MVSKLLLSVYETCDDAFEAQADEQIVGGLLDHFYEIYAGIGVHKSPELYGAFPTDPYSHTPATKGAQQPGMTGQVKEDWLSRLGELGVVVKNGLVTFNPRLLLKEEFLNEEGTFTYPTVTSEMKKLNVEKDSLCFTYCQIPVVYRIKDEEKIRVYFNSGDEQEMDGLSLSKDLSKSVFNRSGEIEKILVSLRSDRLK